MDGSDFLIALRKRALPAVWPANEIMSGSTQFLEPLRMLFL